MLNMWWNTPGMHEEGTPRPTQQGITIAKDVWMLGAGTSLVLDAAFTPVHDGALTTRTKTRAVVRAEAKAARKAANRTAKRARKQAERVRSQAEDLLPS